MENKTNTASNFDELLMHHSLLFRDSLKDLRSLRKQLYSAAEHFELAYSKQSQQQLVMGTLIDYVNNAMVSTVDHLGSVANKMNEFLGEKVDEVFTAELHFSCLEQRLRTLQSFTDWSGFSQESFLVKIPNYHKQYSIPGKKQDTVQYEPLVEHDLKQSRKVLPTKVKLHSPSHSHSFLIPPSINASTPRTFSFAGNASNKLPEKRSISPLRFSLKRSGSSNGRQQVEKDIRKDIQLYSKKNNPVFKALLTMYKQKKDGRFYICN